ncbi:hypothetical protein TREMEDRAFT_24082, partial [Tremella mesenterica DSM 1558]|uniref:uncharacterized protein n=1 Tax=Tremella mesenterica (strain ATCC 24925 / CBS 8224 / DSM 1558 / NBRC 9311 / NRRL Y-6157 / RJB 2259-6 / UBC 559-6) TaxID=578456 RepID=UPI0003F49325
IATLTLSSSHPYTLDLFSQFAQSSANSLSLLTSITPLPTTKELHTVLKSPFVMKKAQENFMRKTHKRMIKVWNGDRVVVDLWSRYLKEGAIGGVGM